jgi:hypothetical protein
MSVHKTQKIGEADLFTPCKQWKPVYPPVLTKKDEHVIDNAEPVVLKRENMRVEDELEQRNLRDRLEGIQFNINENLDWVYPLVLEPMPTLPLCDIRQGWSEDKHPSISWLFQVLYRTSSRINLLIDI